MYGFFFLIRLAGISTPPHLYAVNGNKGSPIPSGRIGSAQRRRNITFPLSSVKTEALSDEHFITFSIGSAISWPCLLIGLHKSYSVYKIGDSFMPFLFNFFFY